MRPNLNATHMEIKLTGETKKGEKKQNKNMAAQGSHLLSCPFVRPSWGHLDSVRYVYVLIIHYFC